MTKLLWITGTVFTSVGLGYLAGKTLNEQIAVTAFVGGFILLVTSVLSAE